MNTITKDAQKFKTRKMQINNKVFVKTNLGSNNKERSRIAKVLGEELIFLLDKYCLSEKQLDIA